MDVVLCFILAFFGLALIFFGVFYYFALKSYRRYTAMSAAMLLVPALSQRRSNRPRGESNKQPPLPQRHD